MQTLPRLAHSSSSGSTTPEAEFLVLGQPARATLHEMVDSETWLLRCQVVLAATLAILLALAFVPSSRADTLSGSVASFSDGEVRIKLDGSRLPVVGAHVTIQAEVPGLGKVPLDGQWAVSRVEGGVVYAKSQGDTSAQPSAGQSVSITSENPVGSGSPTPGTPTSGGKKGQDSGSSTSGSSSGGPPRPQPVADSMRRVETDAYYLDVPKNYITAKYRGRHETGYEFDHFVLPGRALLDGATCAVAIGEASFEVGMYFPDHVDRECGRLRRELPKAEIVKIDQVRSGERPAWRIRVRYDDSSGDYRHDDDVYLWYRDKSSGIVMSCIMRQGSERDEYEESLRDVIRTVRMKPSNDKVFDDDFNEAPDDVWTAAETPGGKGQMMGDGTGQVIGEVDPGDKSGGRIEVDDDQLGEDGAKGDDEVATAGKYLPGCDASEASKEVCIRADNLRAERRFDEAIHLYNEAIQLDRSHVCAYTGIGWAYGESGQADRGMQQMNHTVEMFPDSAKACLDRGSYATNINRIDIAEADADKAIRLSYCAQAYELRAYCFLERGHDKSAINYLDMAIKIFPDSPMAYKLRARAHRGLGDHGQASADEAKARELEAANNRN